MDLSPGFDLTPEWTRRLRLLDLIHDAAAPGRDVDAERRARRLPPEDAEHAPADLADLAARGWIVRSEEDAIGGDTLGICRLLPEGVDFLEDVRETREDTRARRRAARDAVLQWLSHGEGQPRAVSEVHVSPYGLFFGHPFTEDEVKSAAGRLVERGFLVGQGTWSGELLLPRLTDTGERWAESGRSASDDDPGGLSSGAAPVHVSVTDSQNVNVAAHSPGSSQALNVSTESKRQVLQVADALRDSLPLLGLDAATEGQAPALVEDLRAAANESSPDPGRLRQLLGRVQEVTVSGTGTAIGSALAALATHALQGLG